MPSPPRRRKQTKQAPRNKPVAEDVASFLAALHHPREREILVLRRTILDADPAITEGIKWNSVSFRTTEWFATVHLRAEEGIQLILHSGAKKRPGGQPRHAVPDPAGLLDWLADDRATVKFRDLADLETRRAAFSELLRSWIRRR